tara:strand:+ start:1247 stop:1654 length:408 start_codon:yes stop_codon:yes gene_type:complete
MNIVKSLINLHKMLPHPEGGYYVEVYRSADVTQIYYLLEKNQKSHWHRLKKNEILHFYSGSPLIIYTSKGGEEFETNLIGSKGDFIFNVKKHTWFSMKSTGLYSLIGCTVAPAFKFSDLELAPKDWKPLKFNNGF